MDTSASRVLSTIVCSDFLGFVTMYGCTMCISTEGNVHSFGKFVFGGHGFKDEQVFPPKAIPALKNIKSICCGNEHSICLDLNGNVFTFGSNEHGELGIKKDNKTLFFTWEPQKIDINDVREISCGSHFNMCLLENGDLYSFGINTSGQLGHGTNLNIAYPKKIESLKDIDLIACGENYTICKNQNNEVYTWGDNDNGQLGVSKEKKIIKTPLICKNCPDNIIDIKCGSCHTLLLTSCKSVYSCGGNEYGQLGRKTNGNCDSFKKIDELSEIIRIECGRDHSMYIDINDTLFLCGNNFYGQLGLGDCDNRETPVQYLSQSNIIDISTGGYHTFIKTSLNEIFTFGKNNFSQLGIKTMERNIMTPVQVFKGNEDIWCSNVSKFSRMKSARSVLERSNEEDNSPPKKKQKL